MHEEGDPPRAASRPPPVPAASVRTFLIADIRSYTWFTQQRGDEAAARMAGDFASLAREVVEASGGEVIELRGDEALCVFDSSRQALRAAVELQTRFRQATDDGPAFPLPIGIGLDAGEAVPIEGGYRGGALNMAARLCALAAPGQILATDTVVSLARQVEGIRFVGRRPVRLKGLDRPVRVIEVVPEAGLPPLPVATPPPKRHPLTRTRLGVATLVGAGLVAGIAVLLVARPFGSDFLPRLDANSIGLVDAEARGITQEIDVRSPPSAIATGGGFLWVASEADGTVSRIDPKTHAVETLPLGRDATGIAYGSGSLWVTQAADRMVTQVDPKTFRIVQRIPVGNGPASIAIGAGAVWVANTLDGTVSRISLAGGGARSTIAAAGRPAALVVGPGAVWVADESNGSMLRIDPVTTRIVQATNVGNGPVSVAVGDGRVWVANRQDGTVSRVDANTGSVSGTFEVGASPSSVAAGPGGVWVANEGDGTIVRIDADTGDIENTLSVGSSPNTLALSGQRLWTATAPALPSHRGGVLRAESEPSACRSVDPACLSDIFNETDQYLISLAYDGLVAYRRTGSIAGGALVGDLAVRVPRPTSGGRTYTFQLRQDLRYSNGAAVRASDVRYSLERLLTINRVAAPQLFDALVGAARCSTRPPRRCDLSRGIEVDDAVRTITFHLIKPDAAFVHKLAVPPASVIPAGTPLGVVGRRSVPGTGPYRVVDFAPRSAVRLLRNPYFRVWSEDARPDGYPDEIRFLLRDDYDARVTAVEQGRADWVDIFGLPPRRVRGLLTQHASQLHTDTNPGTFWTFLNTRVPPFDDVRVRRALNYAVDRSFNVRISGGTLRTRATCQILPPGFPGYRPYCPYTRNPNRAGIWSAPDLPKARALVAASHTRGMRVEVMEFESRTGGPQAAGRDLVSRLRELGYRSSLRLLPDFSSFLQYVADSRHRSQLGFWGWGASILAPSDFLQQFSCASFRVGASANTNASEFCDRRIDAKMRQAAALEATEPARANELWAAVDHALVDRAAAVPSVGGRRVVLVSARVGNFQSHTLWGTLLDQLWVR